MKFSNFFALIILFEILLSEGKDLSSYMKEGLIHRIDVRSHGCGKKPPLFDILKQITAESKITLEQAIEVLEQDEIIRGKVIDMMKGYHDCMQTADGIRYRKSESSELSEAYAALYKKVSEALQ